MNIIQNIFKKYNAIDTAILYGSRAKGNYREGSDIDLTLQGSHLNLTILNKIRNELDNSTLPYKFDLSLFQTIENQDILDHIKRVGIVFYKNDNC